MKRFMVCKKNLGDLHACVTWLASRISVTVKRGDIDADQAAMTNIHLKMNELRRLLARFVLLYSGRLVSVGSIAILFVIPPLN
jgi:hypothetical protein